MDKFDKGVSPFGWLLLIFIMGSFIVFTLWFSGVGIHREIVFDNLIEDSLEDYCQGLGYEGLTDYKLGNLLTYRERQVHIECDNDRIYHERMY
ncbi:hypothetical protein LCGC14_2256870, partial [marine sediment metagenome]